ncbi:AraC family transcriptional regulator [Paenibacillus hodogayensis]|uniref:AraC family transcriptional regulator n=1 Tax=Paenibacillus hodogayensis TaxID=279208 RepID=A0ABV5VXU7_9BACL
MNNVVSEWVESRFPLYTVVGIHSLYGTSNMPITPIDESFTVLIAVAGGKGTLRIDEQAYDVVEGSVMVLPAHSQAALLADPSWPLHAYKLSIAAQEQALSMPAEAMIRRSEVASGTAVRFIPYAPAIVADVEELYLHRLPAREVRHVQNLILFHHIIFQLLEQQEVKYPAGEQPSMERSIAYLENHYSDKITREQLAEMAGMSPSHYSIAFKRVTGFSPNEYLSRLRVHRAIELLMSGSGTLREIALKVGYKDEFYLSRRFKQQTGASPSAYNSGSSQRVTVLLNPYTSHLLLLGVEPVVTIAESNEYIATDELEQPQSMVFVSTECSAQQVNAVLLDNRTELIIAAKEHLHRCGLNPGQLRAVAPILEIGWMEMGWKEHLRLIAKAVKRTERAEQWLAVFEREEAEARLRVRQSAVAEDIVTILVMKPEKMFVYGARNVGYVVYQSLGLQPPAMIERHIRKLADQFHSIPIERSELADYAGDRLLVIVYPDEKGSDAHAEAVFQSPDWLALPAVKRSCVHRLDRDEWIPYNPVSIRLQLHRAVALLTAHQ